MINEIFNCIVVDDDPNVLFYMEDYISRTPFLRLMGLYPDATEALSTLEKGSVHLIFSDINMPRLTGLELMQIVEKLPLRPKPRVVFITAFQNLALEGYKVNAFDYVVKPLSFDVFLSVALRAKTWLTENPDRYTDQDYIFLKVEYDLVKVYLKDIAYLESAKDYVLIYLHNGKMPIRALTTLKNLEERLPKGSFVRVHRSFIVSMDKIESINRNMIKIGKSSIPVSEPFRPLFKELIEKWSG